MRMTWVAVAAIALAIGSATTAAGAAEIRLAEQFSMGYLQFNVMKRDKLIEKYATQRGLKDFKVSWQRFNGPVGDERGAAVELHRHRQRRRARPDHAVGQDQRHLVRGQGHLRA